MPRERSIDIDDKFDLNLVRYLLLKNEKKKLVKFNLKKKKVFIVGGSGLLGNEIISYY